MSPLAVAEVRCQHGERRCDDKVVMAASRLQAELASCARLEDELSKLPAQQIAAKRMVRDSHLAAPHGGTEPLDQPRFPNNQAVSLHRSGGRAVTADQADAHMPRCFRQHFRSGVAEAALIEDEEVEACEVRGDQGELLAQRSLRQAQRSSDGEPIGLHVEEHERTVVLRRARSRPATSMVWIFGPSPTRLNEFAVRHAMNAFALCRSWNTRAASRARR